MRKRRVLTRAEWGNEKINEKKSLIYAKKGKPNESAHAKIIYKITRKQIKDMYIYVIKQFQLSPRPKVSAESRVKVNRAK
jgi:hypothetical protein